MQHTLTAPLTDPAPETAADRRGNTSHDSRTLPWNTMSKSGIDCLTRATFSAPTSIKFNRFLKLIFLETSHFWLHKTKTHQKWLVLENQLKEPIKFNRCRGQVRGAKLSNLLQERDGRDLPGVRVHMYSVSEVYVARDLIWTIDILPVYYRIASMLSINGHPFGGPTSFYFFLGMSVLS